MISKRIKYIVPFCILLFTWQTYGCVGKQTHRVIATKKQDVAEALPSPLKPIDLPAYNISNNVERPKRKQKTRTKNKAAKAKAAAVAAKVKLDKTLPENVKNATAELKILSPHEANLSATWDNNAFKYLSIDGDRYTYEVIQDYIEDPGSDSLIRLDSKGELHVALGESFELEIAFYPPNTAGHETFEPFQLTILNQKNKIVHKEKINNRIQVYTLSR